MSSENSDEIPTKMSDESGRLLRRSAPRGRLSVGNSSLASSSSQEQTSFPFVPQTAPYTAPSPPPATPFESGTMHVELLVQQPGREHLRILHPHPRGQTTWFNKSSNGISRSINQMIYSMLRKGYPTYSVVPAEDRELWFR
ncbi:hypothetical protein N665_0516s0019 [Sinapis alba]|nr:hypothetical protein N665_0516s0019 [Sinapis alba]